MTTPLRRARWWLSRRRKEDEVREELQFHLDEEREEHEARGASTAAAARAARRDFGNATLVREDARATWSWILFEQLLQDVRYGLRGMWKHRLFTSLAALSLALGIGANTAIYSFMDGILLRSLPVGDPESLVVLKWRSKPFSFAGNDEFVLHAVDGSVYRDGDGAVSPIFPFPAFQRLREVSGSVLSGLFAHKHEPQMNVIVDGEAALALGEYVSGEFFRGLAVRPSAGRLIQFDDDKAGAPSVVVLSFAYSERRFGSAGSAVGRSILVNNQPFTVIGVTPREFFGVDPGVRPDVFFAIQAMRLFQTDGSNLFTDPNYYWVEMMGRLEPGVDLERAQAVLADPFARWVAGTASTEGERANLPRMHLEAGATGLDTLRRKYSKPVYVLLALVGLILAIACANTANLLLARAAGRSREIAARLSLDASRWRVVRQLLTESVLLAALSGGLGIAIALAGIRMLTALLANGAEGFTLHAELNWHVLLATLALSVTCGVLFGVAPALRATRPDLMSHLKERSGSPHRRLLARLPRVSVTQFLIVAQIATSLLLLVAAGLFVRTLSHLQSMPLGFNSDHVLLFDVNAPQAGLPDAAAVRFYDDLQRRLAALPGVRHVTLSHASLLRAGRGYGEPRIDGRPAAKGLRTRILLAGPQFFTTMQIPILRGRAIADTDRQGSPYVAVVSQRFARESFSETSPIGRHLDFSSGVEELSMVEIVSVAVDAQYGPLKETPPPVVYLPYSAVPRLGQMTYALRTDGDPLSYASAVRQIVHAADSRVPVANLKTQADDIDQTINQEIVFARLCTAFAVLALTIAGIGLYATMAYAVERRTNEIGLRMALGAKRHRVTWNVLREVCVLAAVGVAIAVPIALATSHLLETLLFATKPNDPQVLVMAAAILLTAALLAGY